MSAAEGIMIRAGSTTSGTTPGTTAGEGATSDSSSERERIKREEER